LRGIPSRVGRRPGPPSPTPVRALQRAQANSGTYPGDTLQIVGSSPPNSHAEVLLGGRPARCGQLQHKSTSATPRRRGRRDPGTARRILYVGRGNQQHASGSATITPTINFGGTAKRRTAATRFFFRADPGGPRVNWSSPWRDAPPPNSNKAATVIQAADGVNAARHRASGV